LFLLVTDTKLDRLPGRGNPILAQYSRRQVPEGKPPNATFRRMSCLFLTAADGKFPVCQGGPDEPGDEPENGIKNPGKKGQLS
jgi:hypothetical protein